MAATVKGTAHLYGIAGTVSNATVTSFQLKKTAANQASTVNESGNVIERRYDDLTDEATISIRIRTDYTIPAIGSTLVYATVTYEVVSASQGETSNGFREVTLEVKKSEGITYA